MKIELRGVNPLNKGAELMLVSLKQILEKDKKYQLCLGVGPGNSDEYCINNNLKKLSIIQKKFFQLFYSSPDSLKLNPYELDVILDASGFAYGDQWGVQESFVLYRYLNKLRAKNKELKVILMPQALGKFDKPLVRFMTRKAFNKVDLIFARDSQSYSYLQDLNLQNTTVKKSPDFTNIVEVPSNYTHNVPGDICFVPNSKMIQKGGVKDESSYLNFMKDTLAAFIHNNNRPFILVHDKGPDLKLAKQLQEEFLISRSIDIPLIVEDNPLAIKYIIGKSNVLVGSRFHSLVSALSQNIPVIATGWSHKYNELLLDYGVRDYLVDLNSDYDAVEIVNRLINNKEKIAEEISKFSPIEKEKTILMWKDVIEMIEG